MAIHSEASTVIGHNCLLYVIVTHQEMFNHDCIPSLIFHSSQQSRHQSSGFAKTMKLLGNDVVFCLVKWFA